MIEAEGLLRQAHETDPGSLQIVQSLAELLMGQGRARESADLLARGVLALPGDCLRVRLLHDALAGADPALLQTTLAQLRSRQDSDPCAQACLAIFERGEP